MEIAIMGAGLSGLACAITLEKNGVKPSIFEDRKMVGDRFINMEAIFNILNRPVNNCLSYFKDKYDIHLEPISEIKKVTFHSKNGIGSIEGNLGISNLRGRHKNSFEQQLSRQVKSEIILNSQYRYEDLKRKFSHVILAAGDGAYSRKLNNFRVDLSYTLKGATVEGRFNTKEASVWFNSSFVPKGYCYLVPFNENEAQIVLAYPDYPENKEKNLQDLWENFYNEAEKNLDMDLNIIDSFEITRYIAGKCKKPKIDNTYFVGNCFGALTPALGFGQFTAILTGIYAAYDLLGLGSYEELTKPLLKNYENSLVMRRFLESLEDKHFDLLFNNLDNKLLEKFIDKLYGDDTKLDINKIASYLLRPFVEK